MLYREVGSGKAWANYATGANNTGVSPHQPRHPQHLQRRQHRPRLHIVPHGLWVDIRQTYEFGAYTTAATSKNSALPIATLATYTPMTGCG